MTALLDTKPTPIVYALQGAGIEARCACDVADPTECFDCIWYDADGSKWQLISMRGRIYTACWSE